MKFTAALAQVDSRVGDVPSNIDHHLEFINKAIRQKARLVMFPELSLTGYTLRDLAWEIAIDPRSDKRLEPLKKRSKSISILVGFVESGPKHGVYNSAMFLEDGEIKHIHRKVYPPTYGMFEEGRYFSSGDRVQSFDSKLGRFGMLICEDLWHLSLPYILAVEGAEVVFSLTASPTRVGGDSAKLETAEINHEHHRSYARLLNLYLLFCNRVGFEDGVNFWGGSSITSPSGDHVARGKLFAEDLVLGEVDSREIQRARRFSRHFLDERPELLFRSLQRLLDSSTRKK
ncbi:MAG: acyltransferase [Ignavibacteriales bacterium]|nr:acyltransferase [Ignavibacteriales bacterium]